MATENQESSSGGRKNQPPPPKRFPCDICGGRRVFKTQKALVRHITRFHRLKYDPNNNKNHNQIQDSSDTSPSRFTLGGKSLDSSVDAMGSGQIITGANENEIQESRAASRTHAPPPRKKKKGNVRQTRIKNLVDDALGDQIIRPHSKEIKKSSSSSSSSQARRRGQNLRYEDDGDDEMEDEDENRVSGLPSPSPSPSLFSIWDCIRYGDDRSRRFDVLVDVGVSVRRKMQPENQVQESGDDQRVYTHRGISGNSSFGAGRVGDQNTTAEGILGNSRSGARGGEYGNTASEGIFGNTYSSAFTRGGIFGSSRSSAFGNNDVMKRVVSESQPSWGATRKRTRPEPEGKKGNAENMSESSGAAETTTAANNANEVKIEMEVNTAAEGILDNSSSGAAGGYQNTITEGIFGNSSSGGILGNSSSGAAGNNDEEVKIEMKVNTAAAAGDSPEFKPPPQPAAEKGIF